MARSRSRATVVRLLLAAASTYASGCMHYPYTRAELEHDARTRPERSLVHYLAQPNADPNVCQPGRGEPLREVDADLLEAVVEAITDGKIGAEQGGHCLARMLEAAPSDQVGEGLEEIASEALAVLLREPLALPAARAFQQLLVFSEASAQHPQAASWLSAKLGRRAEKYGASRAVAPARKGWMEAPAVREARVELAHREPCKCLHEAALSE